MQINMNKLMVLRAALKEQAAKHGVSFTYMPVLIKAVSLALQKYPLLNASLHSDGTSVIFKVCAN